MNIFAYCQVMKRKINRKGQGIVEYGFIILIIAIGLIAVLGIMKGQLVNLFETAESQIREGH